MNNSQLLPTPDQRTDSIVMIYDGHCQFCTAQVRRLARWDRGGRLSFVSLHDPLVATVSLGERRRFLMRPGTSGSPTHRFRPGGGDLLIMGGSCQHTWQHTVPKESGWAGARMSVTIRHSREGWWVTRPDPRNP